MAAAASQYPGYAVSFDACAGDAGVSSLDDGQGSDLVAFYLNTDGVWTLVAAGPRDSYSAENLPEGVSLLLFQRWQSRSTPTTPAPVTEPPPPPTTLE